MRKRLVILYSERKPGYLTFLYHRNGTGLMGTNKVRAASPGGQLEPSPTPPSLS